MPPKRNIAVVTGGAGFIGSHMVDVLLENDYQVRVIDNLVGGREDNLTHHSNNKNMSAEWVDIKNLSPESNIFSDAKYVFHFAGIGDIVPSIVSPVEYMSTNIQGTVKVLECARHAGVSKFIYAASSSCYGIADVPTTEDHPISPLYPYAMSKYQGEQASFHWHSVYKLPVNSIRIFNAYGTRVRTTGVYGAVFGVFFKQKLAGKPYTIIGDGSQSRDFIYASDVARAFLAAAETERQGEIYNLGAGDPQTINYLVELLDGEKVYIPKRPGEPDCTWADISKIKKQLQWEPNVSFDDGVRMMLETINAWEDAPLWDAESIKEATVDWFKYMGDK